jgi:hypothetical protein
MRVWPAFLAPLIALLDQSVAYSLVEWSCATQNSHVLHWVHFIFFAVAVTVTLPAWADSARYRAATAVPSDAGEAGGRPRMMSVAAALSGALSALVILAMWVPTWFLSPCFS